MKRYELEGVVYREYDFDGRVYVISSPVAFYWEPGSTTHRVVDARGVVHIVPAPGFNGCVLRYEKVPCVEEVQF